MSPTPTTPAPEPGQDPEAPGPDRNDAVDPTSQQLRAEVAEMREILDLLLATLPGMLTALERAGILRTRMLLQEPFERHVQTHSGMTRALLRYLGMMCLDARPDAGSDLDGFPQVPDRVGAAVARLLAGVHPDKPEGGASSPRRPPVGGTRRRTKPDNAGR